MIQLITLHYLSSRIFGTDDDTASLYESPHPFAQMEMFGTAEIGVRQRCVSLPSHILYQCRNIICPTTTSSQPPSVLIHPTKI